MNPVIKKFQFGGHEVTMETGEIARQTSSAIKISIGDTMVLVSAVGKKDMKPGQDLPADNQLSGTYLCRR